ncbi:hypothetical protein [Dyadobacter sp. BHUBP1]|uniref:hypothetical protein n=1 Tax=Dyadobacter sp. BHUBP1 TaxID=3424178 RepID=UPI003D3406DF
MKQIALCLSSILCLGVSVVSCTEPDVESGTRIDKVKAKSNAQARLDAPTALVGVDWAQKSSDNFYYWSGNGTARFGTYNDTDPSSSFTYTYTDAQGLATATRYPAQIIEMAIGLEPGTTVNRVYTYFYDNTFTEGVSSDLDYYSAGHYGYTIGSGHTAADIVGIAINTLNHTYTWYKDGTVSRGTKNNLSSLAAPYAYSLPPGKSYANIIGMGINKGDSDKVYTWYSDGTVSIGTSGDLDYYAAPVPFD